jgi:hypothetical protein
MDDTNRTVVDEDPETVNNPDTNYERSDLSLRVVGYTGLGLAVFLILAPFILWAGFPGIGSDVNRALRVIPPEPRLQTNPPRDLAVELSRQRALLSSYGWVDRANGIARVPVSVAMKHAAEQGIDGFPTGDPASAGQP